MSDRTIVQSNPHNILIWLFCGYISIKMLFDEYPPPSPNHPRTPIYPAPPNPPPHPLIHSRTPPPPIHPTPPAPKTSLQHQRQIHPLRCHCTRNQTRTFDYLSLSAVIQISYIYGGLKCWFFCSFLIKIYVILSNRYFSKEHVGTLFQLQCC